MIINLRSEDIRYLLQNAGRIKKDCRCIECNGTGWENWNEYGCDIKPGKSNSNERFSGECESCDGIGFVIEWESQ